MRQDGVELAGRSVTAAGAGWILPALNLKLFATPPSHQIVISPPDLWCRYPLPLKMWLQM